MKKHLGILTLAGAVAVAAGLAVVPGESQTDREAALQSIAPEHRDAVRTLQTFSDGFAAVSEAVLPSVVTITSERMVQPAQGQIPDHPFFRRFFENQPEAEPRRQQGLGSGVIVDSDGMILTNNHVIRNADELVVTLTDGREFQAEVLGSDARTDLAVLKIDADNLPAARFGNSDALRIGEWVLAVGSPFSRNLSTTVTTGIVSATGRHGINLNEYEDYIQTDAAINPGNSGGALVNLYGEVIGINTAIASRTGASNGVGFAIPANLALEVMADLVNNGSVTRGWLGVGIQPVTADLAQAMELPGNEGVLITSVVDGGPAANAGLAAGDVIVGFDGAVVEDLPELRLRVARTDPGTEAKIEVFREGRKREFDVKVDTFPEDVTVASAAPEEPARHEGLGLVVQPLTPQLATRLELDGPVEGLVVTGVQRGSAAAEAGIRPGDMVVEVNRRHVDDLNAFTSALDRTSNDKPVLLRLQRGDRTFFAALRG